MKNTIIEKAVQMTILDAIEKGHIKSSELVEYMKTDIFKNSVNHYVSIFEENF